ncbi:DUF4184 family protein [Paenibacillus sp. MBLB4367]|uniref:DUF4184 family protein n=1 Tax=Paenibacillus sp. MBLB4367 TaxID=3384767 RepID=UPI00390823DB
MPFTFAHPLYAFPLKLAAPASFSMTGLVLGSMSPDFEYFIALEPYQAIGHTHAGLLAEALPLCTLLAFLFHRVIRMPLAVHLPSSCGLDARAVQLITPWELNTLRKWIVFVLSVAAGFYSHVLLDGFTHSGGAFVGRLPLLKDTLAGIPLYKIGQHSLSLIGLAVQTVLLASLLLRKKPAMAGEFPKADSRQKRMFWLLAAAAAAVTIALKLAFTDSANGIGILVVSTLSGGFLGITATSAIWTVRFAQLRRR